MAFVLTLAFFNGCATVISKMINYRCTKILGTNNGSLVNYVVASVVSFLLLLVSSRFHIDFYSFVQAPWWMYLGRSFRNSGLYYLYDYPEPPESDGIYHPPFGGTAYRRNSL